jgi:hypothetical protein
MIYRWIALGATLVGLGGCGQEVTGNSSFVSVSNVWSEGDALPKATVHCSKWGKEPRLKYFDNIRYTASFDCIRPS